MFIINFTVCMLPITKWYLTQILKYSNNTEEDD
jgi:hypothetical protein